MVFYDLNRLTITVVVVNVVKMTGLVVMVNVANDGDGGCGKKGKRIGTSIILYNLSFTSTRYLLYEVSPQVLAIELS